MLAAQPIRRFTPIERVSNALFVAMHLALPLVFFVALSWKVGALAIGGYGLRMLAVTAGYHRYFAHRSYKTSRAFQFVLAALGATTMQNGPIWWASVHRRHHKESDGPSDLHSPTKRGFAYAHVGWAFDLTVPLPRDERNVTDLTRYPEIRWIDRHDWIPLGLYGLVCAAIGGSAGFVWGFVVSTLAVFHATMLINSLAHMRGSRVYPTGDQSRNNALLAVITLGEGWHNNHHHRMTCARHGLAWWEIDVTYYVLRALARVGVVWAIREPTAGAMKEHVRRLRDSRLRSGAGADADA
ncbi:MAG TPA: fatty acid desaturase [Polyangiaceae bacterium]|jgi:stearoyl-CoA desaturase (delta-9 desaturase)|nr:fatty acid desaturase [Polyangiaceae bacterium]